MSAAFVLLKQNKNAAQRRQCVALPAFAFTESEGIFDLGQRCLCALVGHCVKVRLKEFSREK